MRYSKCSNVKKYACIVIEKYQSSSIAQRLARGSLWGGIGSAGSRVLILFAMVIAARIIGQESFGELGVVQSTMGTAGLMAGMGLGATATRYIAKYSIEDPIRTGRIIGLLKIINGATILLVAITLLVTIPYISKYILSSEKLTGALTIGVLLMMSNALRGLQNGTLAGFEKFDSIAKINLLEGVVTLIAIVICASEWGLSGAIIGLVIGSFASWLLGLYYERSIINNSNIHVSYKACHREKGMLLSYSLPSFMANLVGTPVLWYCITLLAREVDGYNEMGIYNAAYQWHGPIIFLPMIVMSTSIPILVKEWSSGNKRNFNKVCKWICLGALICTLPPVIIVSTLSKSIMELYGEGFSQGWLVLAIIVAAAPFHALSKITSGALLGMNQAWKVLVVNIVWALVMLLSAHLLIYEGKALGLAVAFLVSYFVQSIVSIILIVSTSRNTHTKSI